MVSTITKPTAITQKTILAEQQRVFSDIREQADQKIFTKLANSRTLR